MSSNASAGFDRLRPRTGTGGPDENTGRPTNRERATGPPGPPGTPASPGAPRSVQVAGVSTPGASTGRDAQGKRALYSGVRPPGNRSAVLTVDCSRCGRTSTVSLRRALWVLTPSVHLPLPRRHPSLLRCPACGRPSWVRLALRTRP
ncbi:hypothetical protein ACG83_06825 [Frankia sp. R43]|uniref:hypothetical protein n=1 Tax=Frankia sp. R43 TaxID=269536 RepID=UPI0006CA394B|nr:hypothetical protein [Frankia sp. R43]KPM57412.1 hypothetical protein ACG83_06825 [Frankia sp. R43]